MSLGWRKGFADVVAAIRGTLADAVNAGSLAAVDFAKLATIPTAAPVLTSFSSGAIDLLSTQAATDLTIPIVAGKLFYVVLQRFQVTSSTGTGSGTWTVQLIRNGSNFGAAINVLASTVNAFPAASQFNMSLNGPIIDPTVSHPFQFQVTSAFGGFSAASGKIALVGYYA